MSIESLSLDVLSKIFGEFDIQDARNFRLTCHRFANASMHNNQLAKRFRKMKKSMKMCKHYRSFKYAPCQTRDIVIRAISHDIESAKYIKWSSELLLDTINIYGTGFVAYIKSIDENTMRKIVEKYPRCLLNLPNPSQELCKSVICKEIDLLSYQYIKTRSDYYDLLTYGLSVDWRAINYISNNPNNIKLALDTFYKTERIIPILRDNKTLLSPNVLGSVYHSRYADDIISYALEKQTINIIYCGREFMGNNPDILRQAILENPLLIGHEVLNKYILPQDLYHTCVKLDPRCLQLVPTEFRTEEMCITAIKKDINMLRYVPVYTQAILSTIQNLNAKSL